MAVDLEAKALEALAPFVVDPAPRPLFGTPKMPGIFKGTTRTARDAAEFCRVAGWIEPTGELTGKPPHRKELYRITDRGLERARSLVPDPRQAALELMESLQGVGPELAALRRSAEELLRRVATLTERVHHQTRTLVELVDRMSPEPSVSETGSEDLPETPAPVSVEEPLVSDHAEGCVACTPSAPEAKLPEPPMPAVVSNESPRMNGATMIALNGAAKGDEPDMSWLDDITSYVMEFRRRLPLARCSLPELYRNVASPRRVSISEFHKGLRTLASQGQIRLEPFSGTRSKLVDAPYALVEGAVITYYASPGRRVPG